MPVKFLVRGHKAPAERGSTITDFSGKIRVGVDVRILSRQLTGIGRQTLELCHSLCKNEKLSLHLYSPAPIGQKNQDYLAGAALSVFGIENSVYRQIWAATHLPVMVRRDAIDVFWGPAHAMPRLLPSNVAKVVSIHDLVWKYFGETMRPASRISESIRMPSAVRQSDQIVTISQATSRSILKEFSAAKDKVNVIPLAAAPTTEIAAEQELSELGINRPYFLFVGTQEPRKNLSRLLEAYAGLSGETRKKATLVIAGGRGWGDVQLSALVKNHGLSDDVCVIGYSEDPLLARLYANALFLAMPSLYEGFGLPIIEAMSHGTPVLTADNSSMPEVAGAGGLLVDALSVNSIQEGLGKLISDDKFRHQLATHTKANAALYSWDKAGAQLAEVFEKAIAARDVRVK